MRAYMSTGAIRGIDNAGLVWRLFGTDATMPDHAVLEAQRILEDTEPGILSLVGLPWEQSVPVWVRTLKGDPDRPARRALADALRAFVEE